MGSATLMKYAATIIHQGHARHEVGCHCHIRQHKGRAIECQVGKMRHSRRFDESPWCIPNSYFYFFSDGKMILTIQWLTKSELFRRKEQTLPGESLVNKCVISAVNALVRTALEFLVTFQWIL